MPNLSRRAFLKRGGLAAAALGTLPFAAPVGAEAASPLGGALLEPAWHLVNRLGYGPRPEEVARARQLGAKAFVLEQLEPEALPDDEADARLARLPLLTMDRRTLYGLDDYQGRCYQTLITAAVVRAVYSRRQLLERMVEFWSDHFNVPADFDLTADLILFQRDAVRKYALGSFRDLLLAVARSPAMLAYLDNASNVKDHPNENWARELLELHTLGVEGGYDEQDVKEVARAFTGWSIHEQSGFYFDPDAHDTAPKRILGHDFPAGRGIEDGLHVLGILANHPSTARFVSSKLCRRFVSDTPDEALMTEMTRVWLETGGDIKALLGALFASEAFGASVGAKLRRPFDFFVGALRASGTEVYEFWAMHEMLEALGQLPYGWHPPDGYPDTAGAWFSTHGLLMRWNTAMHLTHGAHSDPEWDWGVRSRLHERTGEARTVGELVEQVSLQVFGVVLGREALEPFIRYASDEAGAAEPVTPYVLSRKLASLYGLMLASPQYQWR